MGRVFQRQSGFGGLGGVGGMLATMQRRPEPELMDLVEEAVAYAAADFGSVNRAFVDRLMELVGPDDRPIKLLDLGCGPGDIPIDIGQRRPDWTITAVDGAPAMLLLARGKAGNLRNIEFVLDDAKTLASVQGAFDVIISNSLLHHLPDPLPFWKQIARLARPRTLLFLRDLARPESVEDATRIVQTYAGAESELLQQEFHRSLLSAFTVEEVRAQLRETNITGMEVAMVTDRHLDVWGRFA